MLYASFIHTSARLLQNNQKNLCLCRDRRCQRTHRICTIHTVSMLLSVPNVWAESVRNLYVSLLLQIYSIFTLLHLHKQTVHTLSPEMCHTSPAAKTTPAVKKYLKYSHFLQCTMQVLSWNYVNWSFWENLNLVVEDFDPDFHEKMLLFCTTK